MYIITILIPLWGHRAVKKFSQSPHIPHYNIYFSIVYLNFYQFQRTSLLCLLFFGIYQPHPSYFKKFPARSRKRLAHKISGTAYNETKAKNGRWDAMKKMKQFLDCNCWALCCAGFGLGVVLAVFASLKLVLILAGFLLIALGIRILLL